ncbi:MAG TPA: sigma-70 family RNA polymerase sigma factor [Myxococcaceae bacterium]|nr:sigma-70 family RNA polymerase sigma factor [Myxococcaceae bacterium]
MDTLVQRIRAGETTAERDLVERFSRGIRAILQTVARERAVSEDLHQEALRILLERVRSGGVRDPAQLPAFVASLARNLATRHYQRSRRLAGDSTLRLARIEDERPSAMEELLLAEQRALVRRIVEEMPVQRDRDLLRRYYLGQESKERIQADHGLSSLQFNRVLHRARKRFQELWEARQSGGSEHL